MELWIKSQDKKQLSKIVGMLLVDKELRGFTEYNQNYFELGKYNTEERALEVLDEIQNTIIKLSALSITGISNENIAKEYVKIFQEENITSLKAVYEMPKE